MLLKHIEHFEANATYTCNFLVVGGPKFVFKEKNNTFIYLI